MRPLVPFLCLAVAACAGSQSSLRTLEASNALSIAPGATAGEYVVTLRNVKDFGYDPDDPASRRSTAQLAIEKQCAAAGQAPRIIGEQSIETGTYLLGNPSRTYAIRVRCA